MPYLSSNPDTDRLPIRAHLTELLTALQENGSAVLVSPPGTGKTTLVPLALADALTGRIVVAQPRRVAARAAAQRMASLVGEKVGRSIGYSVRGESRRSQQTRVEVVTTGLLVRRMQHDPELAGVAAVVLDECHERSLETDLSMAFAVDIRANLRPELLLLAMSATTHAASIAQTLGGIKPAPIVESTGAIHPLEIRWCAPSAAITPAQGTRVDPALLRHVAAVTSRAAAETTGDILVFLPGVFEIEAVAAQLTFPGLDIQLLHGSLSAVEQDRVLSPSARRRVVLATAIAESSLTVPGVAVVVDAGLSRVVRADVARGLSALVTIRESKASATQRAGRAGRLGPGTVYRCWPESEHEWLPDYPDPEVMTADLTAYALELACWGNPGGNGLALLEEPPRAAMETATALLGWLGATDSRGRATKRGQTLSNLGVHPRLGRALLDGSALAGDRCAAEVVALLNGEGRTAASDDLLAQWRSFRAGSQPAAQQRVWRDEVDRLRRRDFAESAPTLTDDAAVGLMVGLAYPERISKLRSVAADTPEVNRTYLMAGGTAAELARSTRLSGAIWLAVADADRPPGHRQARIRSAVIIDRQTAMIAGATLVNEEQIVQWRDGDVRSADVQRLGAITLVQRPLQRFDPDATATAIREGLRQEGMKLFRWSAGATELRARLAACHAGLGLPWPAVDDVTLLATLDVSAARNRADLLRIDLVAALRSLLSWQQSAVLEELAPERITVPSGSQIRIDYADPEAPTLPVKVQEVFGWTVPTVAGRPLRLTLLTPAGRTAAITSDLVSFWVTGYPGLRADLRGRYPRHPWPADPAHATATSRVNPRR